MKAMKSKELKELKVDIPVAGQKERKRTWQEKGQWTVADDSFCKVFRVLRTRYA